MADVRGLLGDSWAFTKALGGGAWDAGAGMLEGLGDLAKGGYKLATDEKARESAWETTKQLAETAGDYGESVIEDPGKAYRDAKDGTLVAYDRFEKAKDLAAAEGRSAEFFGDMAGSVIFEVGTILIPAGLAAKAGKLGKVASIADEVADAGKIAKKIENAEDVFGSANKAKSISANPAIKELDDKVSLIEKCPVADCDNIGVKNTKPPPRKQIELEPGQKGGWNKKLNGKLEANTDYKVDSKTYKTDELGRVKQVNGELSLKTHDRNTYQQGKSGKEDGIKDGLEKDDGGHLISSRHDGAGEQINYVPMDSNLNRGAWKKMENGWDDALKEGKKVEVDINPIYKGASMRPDKFKVIYKIDEKEFVKKFKNAPRGK